MNAPVFWIGFADGGAIAVRAYADSSQVKIRFPCYLRIADVYFGRNPGGSAAKISLYKNGDLIIQIIVADGTAGETSGYMNVPFLEGDMLGWSIDQVGATTPGYDMALNCWFVRHL